MNHLHDDQAAIEEIHRQAPTHTDYNDAKLAYYNAQRNIPQALADLWKLPPLPEKSKPTGVNAEKWSEVRKTCDEFDAAASEALDDLRRKDRLASMPGSSTTVYELSSPLVTIPENVHQE